MPVYRMAAVVALVTLAGAASAAHAAADPDSLRLADLKIGMSPQEVEAALARFNPRLHLQEQHSPSASGRDAVRVLDAVDGSTDPATSAQQIVVMFTHHEPIRAYAIARSSGLAAGERETLQWHMDQLQRVYGQDFGEPTVAAKPADGAGLPGAYVDAWVYDSRHAKTEPADPHSRDIYLICGSHGDPRDAGRMWTATQLAGAPETYLSDMLQLPRHFSARCGMSYRVQLIVEPGSNLVSRWFQDLVSDELAVSDLAQPGPLATVAPAPPSLPPPAPAIAAPNPAPSGDTASDANAAFATAVRYDEGKLVPQDFAAALRWYKRAADLGNAAAMFNVGVMYDSGRGAPMDRAQAASWYARAAEAGHGRAAYNLALLYDDGDGVKQDRARAAELFHLASAHGIAAAARHVEKVGTR